MRLLYDSKRKIKKQHLFNSDINHNTLLNTLKS